MNKYPIWRYLSDARTWGVAILLGCILQGIALYLFSLKSIFLFTAVLFIAIVWFTVNRLVYFIKKFRKKQLEKSLLVVNSFFASWLIAEILLRLWGGLANYSEQRMWHYESHYSPNKSDYWINKAQRKPEIELKNTEYNFKRVRNSAGYSDKEWVLTDMSDKTVVLAFGDSFTEGDGAHADSTWMRFLERKFNSNKLYFMNAGLCGSDPVFDLYNLRSNFMKYHPDIVIACINGSDIGELMVRGGSERFQGNSVQFKKCPWWEIIYASSHISRLIISKYYNEYLIPYSDVERQREKAIRTIIETIAEMKTTCDDASVQLLVVFHPFHGQVMARNNEFVSVIEYCNDQNIAVANLFAFYDTDSIRSNINQFYWLQDTHHNAKGYRLMADAVYLSLLQHFSQTFCTIEMPE